VNAAGSPVLPGSTRTATGRPAGSVSGDPATATGQRLINDVLDDFALAEAVKLKSSQSGSRSEVGRGNSQSAPGRHGRVSDAVPDAC
jgi:hypothetical protein